MSKFRRYAAREVPELNTASLPDLVFTILFFFMIMTTMRPFSVKIPVDAPTVAELQKLEEKNQLVYIIAGDNRIQLNSDFVTLDEMLPRLETLRKKVAAENQDKMVAVLKMDKNTPMGVVNDIKQTLRQAQILTVYHSAEKKSARQMRNKDK